MMLTMHGALEALREVREDLDRDADRVRDAVVKAGACRHLAAILGVVERKRHGVGVAIARLEAECKGHG